jgi:NitT/TauT family transport system permease protein
MNTRQRKQLEAWAPWALLVVVIALWQLICSAFNVSEFIFPSPARIWTQFVEFKGEIAKHAWRTFWVTLAGFGLAIVFGVLLGFLIGRLLRFQVANGLISLAGNLAVMRLLVGVFGVPTLIANGAAIAVCSLANFAASEWFVFRGSQS